VKVEDELGGGLEKEGAVQDEGKKAGLGTLQNCGPRAGPSVEKEYADHGWMNSGKF